MSTIGLLPQRWRTRDGDPHQAEALAGVLDTAPLVPSGRGLVLCTRIGTQQLLPALVALKSLQRQLGRGRCVVLDDGTLTGADRTTLAHHLGDPPITPRGSMRLGGFPPGCQWEPLIAALDGRGGEYWLLIDPHAVALGEVPEIARAIAANRSLWGPGLFGLSAGGPRRPDAERIIAALAESDLTAREMLMVREAAPVALPADRYRTNPAQRDLPACALAAFGKPGPRAAAAHAAASRTALAMLGQ
ncbi:hypothetical protein GRI89_10790 [Altererythrobacter salegens]|uniref:Uncharacterized protein n=1 Tax=Croceibacterium salegens TaxID=1737568 RepID=A0A6I4SVG1_9SPHN|nr:hypothetical protein [Croceibacterium salegens]MXO60025.1 hypothetical protein [Croceibacterium salegens]